MIVLPGSLKNTCVKLFDLEELPVRLVLWQFVICLILRVSRLEESDAVKDHPVLDVTPQQGWITGGVEVGGDVRWISHKAERRGLSFTTSLFLCDFLHVSSCVCSEEEGRRICFRAKTLSDSCFLHFDLRAMRGSRINRFRLSKQFPIRVSAFRASHANRQRASASGEVGTTWFHTLGVDSEMNTLTSARPYALWG